MGNLINLEKKPVYKIKHFNSLSQEGIKDIRQKYKVIDVDWFNKTLIDYKIFGDGYFTDNPHKKQVVDEMVEFCSTDKDKKIYKKKTNYLCDIDEKICICNTHANDFRKIYDGINYSDKQYLAWIEKTDKYE
jgi:hypothetical protein